MERVQVIHGHLQPEEILPQLRRIIEELERTSAKPESDSITDIAPAVASRRPLASIASRGHSEHIRVLLLALGVSPLAVSVLSYVLQMAGARRPRAAALRKLLSNACGMSALQLMTAQLILGSRSPLVERHFGFDKIMLSHRKLAYACIGLAAAHVSLKAYGKPLHYVYALSGLSGLVWGRLAFFGLLLLPAVAYLQRQPVAKGHIPHNIWKTLHYLLYAVTALVYAHSFKMGFRGGSSTGSSSLPPLSSVTSSIAAAHHRTQHALWYANVAAAVAAALWRCHDLFTISQQRVFRIKRIEKLTYDVTAVELDGNTPTRHAGQFAILRKEKFGLRLVPSIRASDNICSYNDCRLRLWSDPHPFTISSAPADNLQFTIKAMPGGKFTQRVSREWKVGDVVHIEGPYGIFSPDFRTERNLIFIAGGVGITPFLSMIRHVVRHCQQAGDQQQLLLLQFPLSVTLVWGIKDRRDLAFLDDFAALQSCLAGDPSTVNGGGNGRGGFRLVVLMSNKNAVAEAIGAEGGAVWSRLPEWLRSNVVQGFLSKQVLVDHVGPQVNSGQRPSYYICGPPPMTKAAVSLLGQVFGVRETEIHYEYFAW